jgi:hypothetical protein
MAWVIYNISQNRHDINKTRMFTLQKHIANQR